jgi:hypothetical protein
LLGPGTSATEINRWGAAIASAGVTQASVRMLDQEIVTGYRVTAAAPSRPEVTLGKLAAGLHQPCSDGDGLAMVERIAPARRLLRTTDQIVHDRLRKAFEVRQIDEHAAQARCFSPRPCRELRGNRRRAPGDQVVQRRQVNPFRRHPPSVLRQARPVSMPALPVGMLEYFINVNINFILID